MALTDEQRQRMAALEAIDVSKVAFDHHVVDQHDLPAVSAQQCALEAMGAKREADRLGLQRERFVVQLRRAERKEAEAKDDDARDLQNIRARELRVGIEQIDAAIPTRRRRQKMAEDRIEELGVPTVEEFEAQELERWRRQLIRQAGEDWVARQTGIGRGNLDAMIQAKLIDRDAFFAVAERAVLGELARVQGAVMVLPLRQRLSLWLFGVAARLGWTPAPAQIEGPSDA